MVVILADRRARCVRSRATPRLLPAEYGPAAPLAIGHSAVIVVPDDHDAAPERYPTGLAVARAHGRGPVRAAGARA